MDLAMIQARPFLSLFLRISFSLFPDNRLHFKKL
jgi:hypothetical protein